MSLFNKLTFEPHRICDDGSIASVMFDNGYGASVITGSMFYTDETRPYELAVIDKHGLCYETPITDDVIGYQTESDIEELLVKIAALPKKEG